MIITIDGPAGSGKSTIASIVAEKLGFTHFNSGSVFRAITAFLLENNSNLELLKTAKIVVKLKNNVQHVSVNNKDYTPILRNNEISVNVAKFSSTDIVQSKAQECMKEFCNKHNVVVDGRGLGNSVFPNAEFKFYLDSSLKERAKRRFNEEVLKNSNITLTEIENQIKERDELDKNRKIAPLIVPKDAIVIDSTLLSIDKVAVELLKHIKA